MILHLSDGASRLELRIESGPSEPRSLSLAGPPIPALSEKFAPAHHGRRTSFLLLICLATGFVGYGVGALGNGSSRQAAVAAPGQPGELPPELKQQLATPPIITPPPSAPATPAGKNPFGLE